MTSDFSARSRQYRDALYEMLAADGTVISDAEPLDVLRGLIDDCRPLAEEQLIATEALEALSSFADRPTLEAALSDVATRFESPQRFREALFFARCLQRDSDSALALLEARAYLEAAGTPASTSPELAVDQALLDCNTFATLWQEPGRGVWLVDTIGIWKQAYAPLYVANHAEYHAKVAYVAQRIDAMQTQVAALERLNTLQRLGTPQAQAALTQYHEIEALFACPATVDDVNRSLETEPVCPYCVYSLGEAPPTADAERVAHAIERGLENQQARLAQRVVTRLLARSGRAGSDRLDRFIEVVQASDLAGLAAVLDDGFVAFLEDLLESPTPTPAILENLAQRFPEITADNLDEAVAEFRALLVDEMQRMGGRFRLHGRDHDA